MKKILLIVFLFFSGFVFTQPNFSWVKQFGGSHADEAVAVETDGAGNVIMVGNVKDTVDADPGPGTQYLFGDYLDHVLIIKLDGGGNLMWGKQVSAFVPGIIKATALNLTASGNIIVSGYFTDVVDFDPGAGSFTLQAQGATDGFVLCLDKTGNFKWAKTIGGSGGAGGTYIQGAGVGRKGDVFVTGYFKGAADFNPGLATHSMTAQGNGDAFLCKLDSSGNFMWAQQFGGATYYDANTIDDCGLRVQTDAYDNIYLAGTFEGSTDFDGSSSSFILQPSSDRADIFILKLTSVGDFVWARQLQGPDVEQVSALRVSKQGEVYLTGLFLSSIDVDPGLFATTFTSTTENDAWYDAFVLKLTFDGNLGWAKQLTGQRTKTANGLYVANNGEVLLTGTFYDTVDFDPGPATHTLNAVGPTDAYILQLNSSGAFKWVYQMGGMFTFLADYNSGKSITCDAAGNIYTAGKFMGTGDMDPTNGTYSLSSNGEFTDIYLMKLGGTVGMEQYAGSEEAAAIYPNPTSGPLKFKTSSNARSAKLYNALGTEVAADFNLVTDEINISSLPKGVYILELRYDNKVVTRKIVKE